jgi:hypothetical protein
MTRSIMLNMLETTARHGGYPGQHPGGRRSDAARAPPAPTVEDIKRRAVTWTAAGELYAVRCTDGVSIPLNRMNLLNLDERLHGREIESVSLMLSSVSLQPFTAADCRASSASTRVGRRADMELWYAEETHGGSSMENWMYDSDTDDYIGPGPSELRN